MVQNLGKTNSIVQDLIADIRTGAHKLSREQFRIRVESLGFIMGYEVSKTLEYQEIEIDTPLGQASGKSLVVQPILATIMRAGLPLHRGLLMAFPAADNCFIGAYRKHDSPGTDFSIQMDYFASPAIEGRTLILCDPMLATGASIVKTIEQIYERGNPKQIIIVSVIASEPGLLHIKESFPNIPVWTAAVDKELDQRGYIVPGLGDAGDLSFGETVPR